MKKRRYLILSISIVVLFSLVLGIYSIVTAKKAKNLYNFAMSSKKVNIHIGEFRGSDKAKDISVEDMIEALKLRLKNRKAINFNIVEKIDDADLSISGKIFKFIYLKKDPIDIYFPPVGLVVDALTDKSYARLEYEIRVLNTKKKKEVWKRYFKATVTEFDMREEDSIPLIIDRAAYVFIKECFGRPKGRGRI